MQRGITFCTETRDCIGQRSLPFQTTPVHICKVSGRKDTARANSKETQGVCSRQHRLVSEGRSSCSQELQMEGLPFAGNTRHAVLNSWRRWDEGWLLLYRKWEPKHTPLFPLVTQQFPSWIRNGGNHLSEHLSCKLVPEILIFKLIKTTKCISASNKWYGEPWSRLMPLKYFWNEVKWMSKNRERDKHTFQKKI